jgi:hypothetical protein
MCRPESSSQIASQYVKWGIKDAEGLVGTDWTRDETVWNRVLVEIASIENLNNVHFMGGETLITKRFEDFVDFMIARDRTDFNVSFVTNGTVFNPALLEKLKRFRRIGIEVSVESLDATNVYQRQGTDQQELMRNLESYIAVCDGSKITLTIRPAISLLTVGSYTGLLEYCLANKFIVKSQPVNRPDYLEVCNLPSSIKQLYRDRYQDLLRRHNLDCEDIGQDYNESDPNNIRSVIRHEIDLCLNLLSQPEPEDMHQRWTDMVRWCQRWDQIHGLDAREIYPEFAELLQSYHYAV